MGIIVIGGNAGGYENVDSDHHAFTNPRPPAFGTLGYYRSSNRTGNITSGSAAGTILWTFRWTDATRYALIQSVKLIASYASTGVAAGVFVQAMYFARNYTVQATGGTSYAPSQRKQMMRTQPMDNSLVNDIRVAGSSGLTAGTWTLDSKPMGIVSTFVSNSVGASVFSDGIPISLFGQATTNSPLPFILAQNEGIVIQTLVTGGGNSGVFWGFEVSWAEVFSY